MSDRSLASMTLDGYLEALASRAPTPGGGAVGAISSATAASLIAMVARLTVGKAGFEDLEDRMQAMIGRRTRPGRSSWRSPTATPMPSTR